MNWNVEKKVYSKKLQQIISGIDKIKNLQGNRILTPEMSNDLEKLSSESEKLLPKLTNEIFEIAVVGLEKAGKSSFSNALTGLAVLPTAYERCTYTSTCLKASETNRAEIEFYSKQEFEKDFQDKLKNILKIPNAEKYSYTNLTLAKYEQLYEDCSHDIKKAYGDSINQDIRDILENKLELEKYIGHAPIYFNGNELLGDEFSSFIKSPNRAIAVKNVTVFSSELKEMPNAVIYDVPGFDSPTAMHKIQTLQRMKDADAIIMVAAADKPSLTSTALSIFRENADDYGCQLDTKMFVFANKADVVATRNDLEENIRTTYNEWINRRKILSERYRNRIFFGSANAHLGSKVDGGIDALTKLQAFGRTTGINEFRESLDTYYKTERFEILKTRVNAILNSVQNVFRDTGKDLEDDDGLGMTEANKLVLKTHASLQEYLLGSLRTLKKNINDEANNQKPLKSSISSKIEKTLTLDSYKIDQDEINDLDKISGTISGTERPRWVCGEIRRLRFEKMHKDFTLGVLDIAVEQHNLVLNKILDLFMDAMNVPKTSAAYSQLRSQIATLCALDKTEDVNYYRSLVDRFSRDLFEIHILLAPGHDRLKKFQKEAANFISLGVFYNDNSYDENTPSINNLLDPTLCKLILYPEMAESAGNEKGIIEECEEKIRKIIGSTDLGKTIEDLVRAIIRNKGNLAAATIETALAGIIPGQAPMAAYAAIKNALLPIAGDSSESDFESVMHGERYLEDRHEREINYSYEQVIKDFADDIMALKKGLLNAFVRATDLDKAFSAKESALIENIISILKTDKFANFIAENLHLIRKDELEQIYGDRAQKELDRAVMSEIRTIIAGIGAVEQYSEAVYGNDN